MSVDRPALDLPPVKLLARSRRHGESDAEAHEWNVEAATYELARDEDRAWLCPRGWDLLSAQVLEH